MECPRCEGSLVTYALGDATSLDCEDCGYVGVPADLSPRPDPRESWEEALERFYERHAADREARQLELGDRTYRVPPALVERVNALTAKQRAVVRELLCEPDPTDPDRTRDEIGEAADVHPSYAGEVARDHEDVVAALAAVEN